MTHTCLKSPFRKLSEYAWVWGVIQGPKKAIERTLPWNGETVLCWNLLRGALETCNVNHVGPSGCWPRMGLVWPLAIMGYLEPILGRKMVPLQCLGANLPPFDGL